MIMYEYRFYLYSTQEMVIRDAVVDTEGDDRVFGGDIERNLVFPDGIVG